MRIISIAIAAALLAIPTTVNAGGILLPGLGAQGQARAGAMAAKADDPSALFHNPAGFAKQTGTVIHIGANLLDYSMQYQRSGVYEATGEDLAFEGQPYGLVEEEGAPAVGVGPFQSTPYLGISTDFGQDLPVRFGFGFFAPHSYADRSYGADYEFDADVDEAPPPGRYDIVSQEAVIIYPSVAVAYSVNDKLDIGVRASWGLGQVKATTYLWGIRNYAEWVARDGLFEIDVKDNFMPTFAVGALFRPTPSFEFGLTYDHGVTLEGKGWGATQLGSDLGLADEREYMVPVADEYVACGTGGTDGSHLRTCLNLAMPRIATVAGRWILRDDDGSEKADVELDVRWENWSAVSDVRIIVDGQSGITGLPINETIIRHGFQDVLSVRLGGAYRMPMGKNQLTLRGGAAYDTATAPQQWTRLDQDGARRAVFAAGVAYDMDRLRFELGGGLVIEPERVVGGCDPDVFNPGCPVGSGDSPQEDRTSPDPLQPLTGPQNQVESPFNAGTYNSGYILISLGASYRF